MNTEQTRFVGRRVQVHAALADATRLRIVDILAVSDASVSEVGTRLGVPSNLLAHHLKVLEGAGLITRRRSEGDARRSYLSLASRQEVLLVGTTVGDGPAVRTDRVLFVCTANTARSHLAAAAWRRVSPIPAASAGTHPGDAINAGAVAAAARHDLDLPDIAPATLAATARDRDLIITVCDRAHEELGDTGWAHWSIPDPVPTATDAAFDDALADLTDRVARLAPQLQR